MPKNDNKQISKRNAKRKKEKKQKQGTIKTERDNGEARIPLPSTAAEIHHFKIRENIYRRCRIVPLTKDQKASGHSYGFPGTVRRSRCRNSCINLRARGYSGGGRCNGCGMRESMRDYEIPLCTDTVVSASRMAARMEVHSITDLP